MIVTGFLNKCAEISRSFCPWKGSYKLAPLISGCPIPAGSLPTMKYYTFAFSLELTCQRTSVGPP